jgi:hypothetical protein
VTPPPQGEDGEGQRLHPFEVAQLANLIDSDQAEDPNDPASQLDECRAVVPSLARFSDEFLVKEVSKRRGEGGCRAGVFISSCKLK